MNAILSLVPLLLVIPIYASVIKLAAFIYGKTKLAWKHSFVLSTIGMLLGAIFAILHFAFGFALHPIISALLGLGIQSFLGGWYLGSRARTQSDQPIRFKGGAILAAIAAGFLVILSLIIQFTVPRP